MKNSRGLAYKVSKLYVIEVFRFVLLSFLMVSSSLSRASNAEDLLLIDSVKIYNSQHPEDSVMLVDNYNYLAFLYGMIDLDSSTSCLEKARSIALKIDYSRGLALNYSYFARVTSIGGDIDTAIQYYHSAISLFEEFEDTLNMLDCYKGMGYMYSFKADQLNCLECNMKALPLAKALSDTISLSVIYNNIGSFYHKIDDYSAAVEYYTFSKELNEIKGKFLDLAMTYSNLGLLMVEHDKLDKAAPIYESLLEMISQLDNDYSMAYIHLSLAKYYNATGALDSSIQHIDKANAIAVASSYNRVLVRVYRRYGEWYLLNKEYAKCIKSFDHSLALSEKFNVQTSYPEIYAQRAEAYFALGKHVEAYKSMEQSRYATDSLESKKMSVFLREFEGQKYRAEREQERLNEHLRDQKLENEVIHMKSNYIIALFLIAFLLISVTLAIIITYKSRKKNKLLEDRNQVIEDHKVLLQESVRNLKSREKELKEANATKDKFFSIIAHDLRSPFSSLIGFSDLIIEKIEEDDTTNVLAYAKLVNELSRHSFTLLNNLLDWALDKVGKMSFTPQPVAVDAFIATSLSYFKKVAPQRTITFSSSIPAGLKVAIDHKMIQSVFRNLISNALKYTPDEGAISVTAKVKADEIEFAIADEGIGMNERSVQKLFKIEEAESTRGLRNEKGTGLGLLLCKDFVSKHGGRIWVESQEGKGSTFYFTVPL